MWRPYGENQRMSLCTLDTSISVMGLASKRDGNERPRGSHRPHAIVLPSRTTREVFQVFNYALAVVAAGTQASQADLSAIMYTTLILHHPNFSTYPAISDAVTMVTLSEELEDLITRYIAALDSHTDTIHHAYAIALAIRDVIAPNVVLPPISVIHSVKDNSLVLRVHLEVRMAFDGAESGISDGTVYGSDHAGPAPPYRG